MYECYLVISASIIPIPDFVDQKLKASRTKTAYNSTAVSDQARGVKG
ncbi:hypothetical protein M595_2814 [Lyngbya aestuarii BL J]|uniref:Uncharacterized protein n=1 Tax=Lyngbya aestuarii BL J TaxID=1348334 RepID=U7QIU2_9CYAN|nr:hypothetical protein M595_2814 [Lyngbya aestuarii BL J]